MHIIHNRNNPIHNSSSFPYNIQHSTQHPVLSTKINRLLILAIVLLTFSACGSSSEQLTITAGYEAANTQISDIRGSATVSRARLQITLDHAGTRAVNVEQQGLLMRSTLVALGTDSAFIANNLPLPGSFPTFTPPPTSPVNLAITPAAVPAVTEELNADGTLVQVTVEATEASNQARLQNIVMASGVDNNDCAIDTNPVFTPNSTEIYVVATAYDIPTGATISSSWIGNGTEVALFSFEASNPINGSCIWFFIDQTDAEFIPGTWSVELQINNVSASPPLPFQIAEN